MAKRIENPADREIRAVIRFLQANNIQPADIQGKCEVYGEGAMSDSMVRTAQSEVTNTSNKGKTLTSAPTHGGA
jgi:hypothetical protein